MNDNIELMDTRNLKEYLNDIDKLIQLIDDNKGVKNYKLSDYIYQLFYYYVKFREILKDKSLDDYVRNKLKEVSKKLDSILNKYSYMDLEYLFNIKSSNINFSEISIKPIYFKLKIVIALSFFIGICMSISFFIFLSIITPSPAYILPLLAVICFFFLIYINWMNYLYKYYKDIKEVSPYYRLNRAFHIKKGIDDLFKDNLDKYLSDNMISDYTTYSNLISKGNGREKFEALAFIEVLYWMLIEKNIISEDTISFKLR